MNPQTNGLQQTFYLVISLTMQWNKSGINYFWQECFEMRIDHINVSMITFELVSKSLYYQFFQGTKRVN